MVIILQTLSHMQHQTSSSRHVHAHVHVLSHVHVHVLSLQVVDDFLGRYQITPWAGHGRWGWLALGRFHSQQTLRRSEAGSQQSVHRSRHQAGPTAAALQSDLSQAAGGQVRLALSHAAPGDRPAGRHRPHNNNREPTTTRHYPQPPRSAQTPQQQQLRAR